MLFPVSRAPVNLLIVVSGFEEMARACDKAAFSILDFAHADCLEPEVPVSREVEREQFLKHLRDRSD